MVDDNLTRSVQRLEIMVDMGFGLEAFSSLVRIKDLWTHYTTRFLRNINAIFSDFSRSELDQYVSRYSRQVQITLQDPIIPLAQLIVPIPRGMQYGYHTTLEVLESLLKEIDSDRLVSDLTALANSIMMGIAAEPALLQFNRDKFTECTKNIGRLYTSNGVTHTSGKIALVSMKKTQDTLAILQTLTHVYYPQVLALQMHILELESAKTMVTLTKEQEQILANQLMMMAYRISLFAVIMDHIQTLEHAFVKVLQVLKDKHEHM